MAYFEDLTPYAYYKFRDEHNPFKGKETFNIGWLSIEKEYNKGSVNPLALDKLYLLLINDDSNTNKNLKNKMRGSHVCEYCEYKLEWDEIVKQGCLGNGEFHIPDPDDSNKVYVAPALICHYIRKHDYKPPDAFINAVLSL